MNAKLCKALRKEAAERTIGWPVVRYVRHRARGAIRVAPPCTRSVYLDLKKAARKGRP